MTRGTARPPDHGPGVLRIWVSDGTRTRDHRHHKAVLYQLSYTHHAYRAYARHGEKESNASIRMLRTGP